MMSASGAAVSPPKRYVVPRVQGDPDTVRRLAAAYRTLADAVHDAAQRVTSVMQAVSDGWIGEGRRGADLPVTTTLRQLTALVRTLDEVADSLDDYATKLDHAEHHHGFSLHKLLAVGAVAAFTVTTVVVTVGAASAADAALATAAVEEATEAAGSAGVAASSAAGGILESFDAMGVLRPLSRFVFPHLTAVEWTAGGTAGWDELTTGRVNWRDIGIASGLTFAGTGAVGVVDERLEQWQWLAHAPRLTRVAVPHLAGAGVWSGVTAADGELITGRVAPVDVLESFLIAGAGTAAHDALQARGIVFHPPRNYYDEALRAGIRQPGRIVAVAVAHDMATLRQSLGELERGDVDLAVHEGPGHTVRRHVGHDAAWLLRRSRAERLRFASTYFDARTAEYVVRRAVTTNVAELRSWFASGTTRSLTLRVTMPYDVGAVLDRRGILRLARAAVVVVRRDAYGPYVVTSFPDLTRR